MRNLNDSPSDFAASKTHLLIFQQAKEAGADDILDISKCELSEVNSLPFLIPGGFILPERSIHRRGTLLSYFGRLNICLSFSVEPDFRYLGAETCPGGKNLF